VEQMRDAKGKAEEDTYYSGPAVNRGVSICFDALLELPVPYRTTANAEDIAFGFHSLVRMMNWIILWHRVLIHEFDIEASNKLFAYHCP
jgi:hypothetical protein